MDEKKERLKQKILNAFENNKFPGNWNLRNSNQGEEPFRVEEAFKGKDDWTKLDAKFLNEVPNGLSSALSFFSETAFRFYLPAYLIADIDNNLPKVDVVFHLCYGITNSSKNEKIGLNQFGKSTIYGETTFWDYSTYRFSLFTLQEVEAIIDYLQYNLDKQDSELRNNLSKRQIKQALDNYWFKRAEYLKNKKIIKDLEILKLKEEIETAFSDIPYPGDDKLIGRHYDPKVSCIVVKDFKGIKWQDWKEEPMDFLYNKDSSISFLSPAGFRYFLPLYMIASLIDYEGADLIPGKIILAFGNKSEEENKQKVFETLIQERLQLMSLKELEAVNKFLEFIRQRHSNDWKEYPLDGAIKNVQSFLNKKICSEV